MATLQELEAALVKADAAGNVDDAKAFAAEIRRMRVSKQPEPDYNPTSGMSGTDKFLAGAGKALTDVVRGVGQVVGMVPQSSIDETKARDKALMETGAGTAGNIAGSVAALLPSALIPGAGTLAGATAIGAAQGALAPVASDESRLQNATMGAVGGAGGALAARGLARVAQPIVQSEAVRKLVSEGVVPTPGQAAGGLAARLENSIESLPLVGQIIKNSKNRAGEELNLAALKRAVPAGYSENVTAVGRRGLEQADEILSQGYERVVPNISIKAGNDFRRALVEAGTGGERYLTEAAEKDLIRVLEGRVLNRIPENGEIPGRLVQRMDSELGTIVREYSKSTDAAQRAFAGAVRDVQSELRTFIASQAKGSAAKELSELNRAFANLVRVEKAAGYVGPKEGVFSASQLQNAVRAADPSRNKGAFARGNALMQDLSDPAKQVMGDVVPDSGTAGRLLTAAGMTGAGVDTIFGNPGYLTALAASPILYSRAGARYMIGDLLPGQAAAAGAFRAAAPYTSILGMGLSGQSGR